MRSRGTPVSAVKSTVQFGSTIFAFGEAFAAPGSVSGSMWSRCSCVQQMIDASTGFHQWSRTYRRSLAEVFVIEEDISKSVLQALTIVLSPEARQRLSRPPTDSDNAYDAYLRGLSKLRNATDAAALDEAARQFEKSHCGRSTFAQAYGVCADGRQAIHYLRGPESVASAEESCARAVQLDSNLPDVHLALGLLYSATGQFDAAETQYRKAIAQDGDLTEAYLGLATTLSERDQGAAAEQTYQRAIRARPRYWASYDAYGSYLVAEGKAADAVVKYRRATELAPDNATAHSNLGAAYFLLGDFANAAAAFRRSVEIAPTGEGYSNTGTMYYFGPLRDAGDLDRRKTRAQGSFTLLKPRLLAPVPRPRLRSRVDLRESGGLARTSLRVTPESVDRRNGVLSRAQNLPSEATTERHMRARTPPPFTFTTILGWRIEIVNGAPFRSEASRAAVYPLYLVGCARFGALRPI